MKDLVEVVKNQAVVSSRQVAEHFKKRHDKLFTEIERMYGDYIMKKGMSKMVDTPFFYENTYIHPQNKKEYKQYLMNRDGFTLLVMGFTGKQALEWKVKYIKAFNKMEGILNRRIALREAGKIARKSLTDTIRDEIPESPHKKFKYKHYTDLVYQFSIGCTSKKFREFHNLDKDANIRDYLSSEQLKKVEKVESMVKSLISFNWDYEQVKNFLKNQALLKLTA